MKDIKVYLVCDTSTLSPEKLLQASLKDGKMLSVQLLGYECTQKIICSIGEEHESHLM